MPRQRAGRQGRSRPLVRSPRSCFATPAPVLSVETCAHCRQEVLEADRIEDEEECLIRDHLLAVNPNTVQPATLRVLLRHFVVTGSQAPVMATIPIRVPGCGFMRPARITRLGGSRD